MVKVYMIIELIMLVSRSETMSSADVLLLAHRWHQQALSHATY